MRRFSAPLFCTLLAVLFMVAHLWFGWDAFVQESHDHNTTAVVSDYLFVWARDTVENMQSEFWQLAVQFLILAGVLKRFGVEAVEDDQEEIKRRLSRLESDVS